MTVGPTDDLLIRREGAVLHLVVNRPERHNPLSRPVLASLGAAMRAHAAHPELRCVVITGAGERYFAAGGDLHDLDAVRSRADTRAMASEARSALDAVREFPLPVVAVLNGDAIGGGAELALACDFRILRIGAGIGFIHGRLGISAAWGGASDLASVVGPARALRMTTRCELVRDELALAWGLADAVAPADELAAEVEAFIEPMRAQSATALRACVSHARAFRRGASWQAGRSAEFDAIIDTWTSPEHFAAVDRFMGRQPSESAGN